MRNGTNLTKIILSDMINDDQTYLSRINENLSTIEFALSDTFSAKSSRTSNLQYTLWRLSREMIIPVLSQQMQQIEQVELKKMLKTPRYPRLIEDFLLSELRDMGAWDKVKLLFNHGLTSVKGLANQKGQLDGLIEYCEALEKHPPKDQFDAIEMFIRHATPDDQHKHLLPILSQYRETMESINLTLGDETPFLAIETIDFYRFLETSLPIISWPEKRLKKHPEAIQKRLLPAIQTMRKKTGKAKNSLDDLQPKLH